MNIITSALNLNTQNENIKNFIEETNSSINNSIYYIYNEILNFTDTENENLFYTGCILTTATIISTTYLFNYIKNKNNNLKFKEQKISSELSSALDLISCFNYNTITFFGEIEYGGKDILEKIKTITNSIKRINLVLSDNKEYFNQLLFLDPKEQKNTCKYRR